MNLLHTWTAILFVVLASTTGEVLISRAMKQIGDLGELRCRCGLGCVVTCVLGSKTFLLGIAFLAMAFFSLLSAFSLADLSLVAPASASLTFLSNAVAAKVFLKERVDKRRWAAALLVAAGVCLLA